MTLLLPKTDCKRILRWAKQDHVQAIFRSWHKQYAPLKESDFARLASITYKVHVKANLV